MGRPGRKRRLVFLEDEYWKLMAAGVGTVEACRRPGIGRTTGYYWRSQRGGLTRTVRAEDSRSGRYLSLLERERIAILCAQGCTMREVARRLGRAASTISRELRRNMRAADDEIYDAGLAHARAREHARRMRRSIFARDEALRAIVQAELQLQGSPEQIAAWLRAEYPIQPQWHVCHETIYQGLYFGGTRGLTRDLARNLRTGRGLRMRRRRARSRRPRFSAYSRMIDERPAVVLARERIGDFEGDLILGRHGLSAIGTLVDRATRYVRLVHVPEHRRGEDFAAALAGALSDLPPNARRTLTWDQASRWLATTCSPACSTKACTSPTQAAHGNAAPTRTPTGCCDSTSPNAPTFAATPSRTSAGSKTFSTTVPGRPSAGPHPPPHSGHSCQNDQANVATTG
jgi:transposase, IS30 family